MDANDECPGVVSMETAKEVVRLSELYLDGTLKLAIAADARAMQIAGLSSAAATALSIFGFNYVVHPGRIDFALGISAFGAGLAFYSALFFALWAAQPREFNISGNIYSKWTRSELEGGLAGPLISQAKGYDAKVVENIDILSENTKRIKIALRFIASAPACAITSGLAGYYMFLLFSAATP